MGQILQTIQEGLSTDDRVEILERTFTDALTATHERDIALKMELEELRKVLSRTKEELRDALKALTKRVDEDHDRLDQHDRYGDYCPHTCN